MGRLGHRIGGLFLLGSDGWVIYYMDRVMYILIFFEFFMEILLGDEIPC